MLLWVEAAGRGQATAAAAGRGQVVGMGKGADGGLEVDRSHQKQSWQRVVYKSRPERLLALPGTKHKQDGRELQFSLLKAGMSPHTAASFHSLVYQPIHLACMTHTAQAANELLLLVHNGSTPLTYVPL